MSASGRALLDIGVGRPLRLDWDSSLIHTLNPLLEVRVTAPDCMKDTNNQDGTRRMSSPRSVLRAIMLFSVPIPTIQMLRSSHCFTQFVKLLHAIP